MPAILAPDDYEVWLDGRVSEPERLLPLLRPFDGAPIEAVPVGTFVNKPTNEGPACIEPVMTDQPDNIKPRADYPTGAESKQNI